MSDVRVAALGDSITLGVGDGTRDQWGAVGWARHAADAWGAADYLCLAANGARARDLPAQAATALAWEPHVVLCSIGGNDALRGDFDAVDVHGACEEAFGSLTRAGHTVVVATIDRIGLFDLLPRGIAAVMASRAGAVNEALTAAAAATGARIVNGALAMGATGSRGWHVDRIHPSPEGHRALAAEALAVMCDRLPAMHSISPAPGPPSRAAQAWWLARHGTPWALRRSTDLLPAIAAVIAAEWVATRTGHSHRIGPRDNRGPHTRERASTARAADALKANRRVR
ncbi:GDSL-type esterase/lipase family protein [Demequina globuliformis]|uniref:GDSL-type esterase/lipase family protein n=1 Tax=Demequina globuliformis TaxID=676202 RepID=UPI000785F392|nr:GDSL-type esterase/lipase family protein [Demequina globuliformis]